MSKEENLLESNKIRTIIRRARSKGYTYSFFFRVINYSRHRAYNFMNHGYRMSDENLEILKEHIESTLGEEVFKEN